MVSRHLLLVPLVLLGACGETDNSSGARNLIAAVEPSGGADDAPVAQFGFAEAVSVPDPFGSGEQSSRVQAPALAENAAGTSNVAHVQPASAQQIAYSYGFGFQISGDRIADLQAAHSGMCEAMGQKCRILRMSQSSGDGWDGYGELQLEVSAAEAGKFEQALAGPAKELGGEMVSSVRDGTDLSDSIIDTEARLKSRLLLRDKLTAILQNNRGSVDELVKAENAIAAVNEEIDANRSRLEQYRDRISYSQVKIEYQAYFGQAPLGFSRPVMTAVRSIGTTLGVTIAALVYAITALVPITLLILALRWLLHRFGLRIRFWRKNSRPDSDPE